MLNDGTNGIHHCRNGRQGNRHRCKVPIIAQTAKEMDLPTIGTSLSRSRWEGDKKMTKHWTAWRNSKAVDALLVINKN